MEVVAMGTVHSGNGGRGRLGRRIGVVVGAVLACVMAGGLGGCNNEMKTKNEALTTENQELRDRNTQLEQSLAEAQRTQAEQQSTMANSGNTGGGRSAKAGRGGRGGADFDGEGVTVSHRNNSLVVAVAGDVLFDSGQATLKAAAKKTLDKVAANIKSKYNGNAVRVEGYTDTDPIKKSKWPSNEALSEKRAEAVRSYLVSKGVSKSMVSAVGMGAANPKSSKKESRRVEIVIVDAGN